MNPVIPIADERPPHGDVVTKHCGARTGGSAFKTGEYIRLKMSLPVSEDPQLSHSTNFSI